MSNHHKKFFLILILISLPFVVYFSNLGVIQGGQSQAPALFSPLFKAYQFIKGRYLRSQEVTDEKLLYGAIEGMVEKLDDPYSRFLDPVDYQRFNDQLDGEFVGVGIQVTIEGDYPVVVAPLADSPAKKAGIKTGDFILQIDGQSTQGLNLDQVVEKLHGEKGKPVFLKVKHESDEIEEITVVRDLITVQSVESQLISEKIGLIKITGFTSRTSDEVSEVLNKFNDEGIEGIIIDLRDNPGGLLYPAIDVASQFVDEGKIIYTESRVGMNSRKTHGNNFPNLPLAVLINGGTASASEIVAGAIRNHQMGILVGRKSFGKGAIQESFRLEDGSAVILTTYEFFTSKGAKIHGVGLFPDIKVMNEDQDVKKALDWIRKHLGNLCPCTMPSQDNIN